MNTETYKDKLKAFEDKCNEQEIFYATCSELLGIEHVYTTPVPYRTRWNNRLLGNGRYKGFGTIQCFGSTIRVMSKETGTVMFNSYEEVYEFLKERKDDLN